MLFQTFALLGVAILSLSACQAHHAMPAPAPVDLMTTETAYRLAPSDSVKIQVFDEQNLSGTFTLNEAGAITLPLIGAVTLKDFTITEAQEHITALYKDGYLKNPVLSLEIAQYRDFFIMGEVQNPGRYEYQPDLNIVKAVALAGGFTYRANKNRFDVNSDHEEHHKIFSAPPTYEIAPGDVIIVKERFF